MRAPIAAVVAAALMFNGSIPGPALAARPVAGDRTLFETWVIELNSLNEEGAASIDAFAVWSQRNQKIETREQAVAAAREFLPVLNEARRKLAAGRKRAAALQPFRGCDPEEVALAARLLADTRLYLGRVDAVLATCEEPLAAVVAEDAPRLQKAMLDLRDASTVMVEGQIAMVRGRQALYDIDDPNHYVVGAMVSLYEGMRSVLNVRMGDISRGQAAVELRAAARPCRKLVVDGRRALGRLVSEPDFVRGSDRYLRDQLAIADEIADALDAAAAAMEGGEDDSTVFRRAIGVFTVLEERYRASVVEEFALPET